MIDYLFDAIAAQTKTVTELSHRRSLCLIFGSRRDNLRFILSAAVFCAAILSWTLPTHAFLNTWTNAVTGSWTDASKWTGGVPTSSDPAIFNKPGTYTVNFSNVFQNLADLPVSDGTVTFERVTSPATLIIQSAFGNNDLTIGTATLNLGQTLPVNITVNSDTIINAGGTLNLKVGSFLNVGFDVQINAGGTLTANSSADITSKFGFIGNASGAVATATVTGAGSTWTTTNGLAIGNGSLSIGDGGKVTGSQDQIGSLPGTTGSATVTGATSNWTSSLTVGKSGTGSLTVENGGTVNSGFGIIGEQATAVGTATVTGAGSNWTVGNLTVGSIGTGTLTIADSGTVNVGGGAGPVAISAASTLNIGAGGSAGTLQAGTVVNSGVLNFDHTDANTVTAALSGNGEIIKAGGAGDTILADVAAFTGSYFVQSGLAILQGNANGIDYLAGGGGTLRFSGGRVNLGLESIQAAAGGAVEYDSATVRSGFLRGPGTHTIIPNANQTTFNGVTTFNSTNIVQDGTASLVNVTNGGTFTNNAPLFFNGGVNSATGVVNVNSTLATYDVGNSGAITVNSGGAINNQIGNLVNGGGSRTTINSGGEINLLGGTTMELNGALLVNNGTVTGTVNVNYGSLAKGTGSYGVVNVNEGGVYSPGSSPGISTADAVNFQTGSFTSGAPRLVMELGGTTPGTQYDQLHVTGTLTLNGTLDVRLVNLGAGVFSPQAGNSFDLLDWGTISGTFSAIQLPTLTGALAWNTSQLYLTGVLSVVAPGVAGDYNNNGIVDAADYVAWRNNVGTSNILPNDPTGGAIGNTQYNTWRSHFGQTAGSGSGAAEGAGGTVPEPAGTSILILAAATAAIASRRHSTRPC